MGKFTFLILRSKKIASAGANLPVNLTDRLIWPLLLDLFSALSKDKYSLYLDMTAVVSLPTPEI